MKDEIKWFKELDHIWRRQAIKKFGTEAQYKMFVISEGKLMTWVGEGNRNGSNRSNQTPRPAGNTGKGGEKMKLVQVRSWYNKADTVTALDDTGNSTESDDIGTLREIIEELDDAVYVTAHNEIGRPEYIILADNVADYVLDGRGGDAGNYAWDNAECDCGECNVCCDMMMQQDADYVRDKAL